MDKDDNAVTFDQMLTFARKLDEVPERSLPIIPEWVVEHYGEEELNRYFSRGYIVAERMDDGK